MNRIDFHDYFQIDFKISAVILIGHCTEQTLGNHGQTEISHSSLTVKV
jgi:hypothetical protein